MSGIAHPEIIADVFRILALGGAIFLWATSLWFFSVAVVSVLHGALFTDQEMNYHLVWWSFIFPNTGFTIATIEIGRSLMSNGILWVGTVMTIMLVAVWFLLICAHIRAVWKEQILWPGKDDDRDQ